MRESDIQHEIDTYNDVLGGPGEFGCTLLVEIDDREARAEKLKRWLRLPHHLHLRLEDQEIVRATFDERQVGSDRVSSVRYLKFKTQGRKPAGVGCDHDDPDIGIEISLTEPQRVTLAADLG